MADKILNSFDTWINAQGVKSKGRNKSIDNISLDGIARLRELILDLAVRGKLVPQNPNEEPASKLLERIAAERRKLEEEGKIKKQKILPEVAEDERPFEIPDGWEWKRLGNIFEVTSSKRIHARDYRPNGIPFFRSKEIGELMKGEEISTDIFIATEQFDALKNESGFPGKGDLMLTSVGSIGNTWICDGRDFYYKDGNITKIRRSNFFVQEYTQLFIASKLFENQVKATVSGTAYYALTIIKINQQKIPVPPFEEQKRIVAKVDELLALCDQLEKQEEDHLRTHQLLVETLLSTLTEAKNADELHEAWQRLSSHFDELFTTEDSIDQLKQTILQLAIMGKLVLQDPNDEPASELLKKIKLEQKLLYQKGLIKKPKTLPQITSAEYPFKIPSNWIYTRLNEIGEWGSGSTPSRSNSQYFGGEIPWFKSGELKHDIIYDSEESITELALEKTSLRHNKVGDVLIAMYGANIGQTSILGVKGTTNQAVCACTPFIGLNNKFLLQLLRASRQRFLDMGAGGAQPNISREKIISTVIALPPHSEQKRIVNKVEELFALCDLLKEKIVHAQAISNNMASSVLEFVED